MVFQADEPTFQTAWFVISLLTELAVVLVLRTRGPAFRSRPSRLLLWPTLVMSGLALATPFLGPVSAAFGFVPLSALEMFACVAIVALYAIATEAVKLRVYRKVASAPLLPKTGGS